MAVDEAGLTPAQRDYQRFLQRRRDRDAHASVAQDRKAFARVHGLAVVDDHLVLPDLRLEVEYAVGRRGVRDVEVVTEHNWCAQVSVLCRRLVYRAAGSISRT